MRQAFERHLTSADTASLIALRDGHAIGLLSLHIRERLSQPVPEAWIPDFVVTAAEQGHGVAQQLMHRALEIARERGCYRVVLESYYHGSALTVSTPARASPTWASAFLFR